jgi:2-phosphoglycerate kinase
MYVFIGGTPAAGKTFTAKQFIQASEKDIHLVSIDNLRIEFSKNLELKYWVEFFSNQDETEYWRTITYEKHIENLINQSEAFWLPILDVIEQTKKDHEHAIFEAVNILPHLGRRDLDIPGFFLICEDYQIVLQRNMKDPRWGKNEELQKLEAKYFVEYDARFIREEAEKYNYKVFNAEKDATNELSELFA